MTDTRKTAANDRPAWKTVREYQDIRYETDGGLAKITICRPQVHNAFRPKTLFELIDAFSRAREDQAIGAIIFTGEGDKAFCSGGDQSVRGDAGYVGSDGVPRLNVLDLQKQMTGLRTTVCSNTSRLRPSASWMSLRMRSGAGWASSQAKAPATLSSTAATRASGAACSNRRCSRSAAGFSSSSSNTVMKQRNSAGANKRLGRPVLL